MLHYYYRLCFLLLAFAPLANAQLACGYKFNQHTELPYTHLPETAPSLELVSGALEPDISDTLSPSDEAFFEHQAIGFDFTFNGSNYSSIGIASNGYIWFGPESPFRLSGIVYPYTNILQSDFPFEGVISALNADLEGRWTGENASIRTRLSGTAPNRAFTIEWRNFKLQGDAEGVGFCGELRNRFDFQIKLLETNSEIQISYNTSPYCFQGFEGFFQIGLRGSSSADVHTRQVNPGTTAWLNSQLGFAPSTAVMRSSAPLTLPTANLTYTFSAGNADSLVWLGINTNWFDPQNWSGNTIPGRCNAVYIPPGLLNYPNLLGTTSATCGNMTIAAGAGLTCSAQFSAHLTIFGNLRNDGSLSNLANTFISLAGNQVQNEISGSGIFSFADLFITAASNYRIGNDLVVRSIDINTGSALKLGSHVLDVFSLQQIGTLNQETGMLILEGHPQHISLNDSTFIAAAGSTFFGNGELWNFPGNQLVPSLDYNNLWVRTNKDYHVQLGDNGDFSCRNLAFYNPGEPGGIAETASNILVSGNIALGTDSLPGTVFIINHNIHQTNGNSPFETGETDHLVIRHASAVQRAISGNGQRNFDGTVTYQSDQTQTVVKGDYRNLTIQGQGNRINAGKLKVKGIMRLEEGVFQSGDSLILASNALGTALISGAGNGILQGKATLQRYIPGTAMQQISLASPLANLNYDSNAALNNLLANNPHFWSFDGEPTINGFASAWQIRQQQELIFEALNTYRTQIQGGTTLSFWGNLNTGDFFLPLHNNSNPNEVVWTNAGNPYPSPLDWNRVYAEQTEQILPGIVNLSNDPAFNGSYSGWLVTNSNEGIGINGGKPWIGSADGFFIQNISNDTLRLNNSQRAEIVSISTAERGCSLPLIKLGLEQANEQDELAVYFHSSGNNETFNAQRDLLKPSPVNQKTHWYSVKSGKNLGIQCRNAALPNDTIPLSISVATGGNILISLRDEENMPATAKIILEDRATNSSYNMRLNPSVSFVLNEGLCEGRFYLHYAKGISITASNAGCNGQSGSIQLQNEGTQNWQAVVYQGSNLVSNLGAIGNNEWLNNLSSGEYRIELAQGLLNVEEFIFVEPGDQIHAVISTSQTEVQAATEAANLKYIGGEAEFLSWSLGDGALIQGSDSISYVYQNAGEYLVRLNVARGNCSDTASVLIRAVDPNGIQILNETQALQAYPNPAVDFTRVNCEEYSKNENLTLHLIDRSGKLILEVNLEKGAREVNVPLNNLPSGRYEILVSGKTVRKTGSVQVLRK